MSELKKMVSVCMITYNHEAFISEAIDCVMMQQTNFPIELVIGEDCSTDHTRKICLEYKEKYPDKIRLLLPESNLGMMNNFLQTLRACTGKYIALCEGDDYWTDPYKLQKQVDFLGANEDYSICFHSVRINQDDQIIDDYITPEVPETTDILYLAKGNYIHTPTVVFRKNIDVLEQFIKINPPIGDYVLHMLNAKYGKIKKLSDCMAVYRIHDGGVWSTKGREYTHLCWLKVLEYLYPFFDIADVQEKLHQQYGQVAYELYDYYSKHNDEKAKKFFIEATLNNIDYLFERTEKEKKEYEKEIDRLINTKAYRLGNIFLKPFSTFKMKVK